MADIKEYLVLEDKFSQTLNKFISQASLSADKALNTQEAIDKISGAYESTEQSVNIAIGAVDSFSASSDAAARSVEGSTSTMVEAFNGTDQSITEVTESIQENAEAVDQWVESVRRIDEVSHKTGRNLGAWDKKIIPLR